MDNADARSQPPRQRYKKRFESLKKERDQSLELWRDIAENISPTRFRYLQTDRNKLVKKNTSIINNTPTKAARVLAAGMMAGITSPARGWFRLTTTDPDLAENPAVKDWLYKTEQRIRTVLEKSNIYNCLHTIYADLGPFGVAPLYIEEDVKTVIRGYVFPVGSYVLANSSRLQVDTFGRECSMTVAQLVEKFGFKACSQKVQNLYSRGQLDEWVVVVHFIEPNTAYNQGKLGQAGKAWKSCWFELEGSTEGGLLREDGFHEFPVCAPRWMVTGDDVYGYGPGAEAIGDSRALQLLEKRKAQLVDKIVTPPMTGPSSLAPARVSMLPGGYTPVDALHQASGLRPSMEVNPAAVNVVEMALREHEGRINAAFFADLWLMMAQSGGADMTAREVAERHEEKMLQLGPIMERLDDELLSPLIDRVFGILMRRGLIPPPPQELQGTDLRVEYISIMSQAQKMLGTSGVERLAGFVGNLVAAHPEAGDKFDFDQAVDEYGAMLGVPPTIIRADEQVDQMRQERAKQAQAQAQAQQMMQAAQGAKTLSQADLQGDSALTRMLGTLGQANPGVGQ